MFDVAVIGLGAVGSQTVRVLAERGARVIGLEQLRSPHGQGSHHGHTRVTRHAYFEHPDYVPLLRASTSAWERLEQQSDARLLERCGVLLVGPQDSSLVRASAQAAATWGVPVETLDRLALQARFPAFATQPGDIGLLEPGGGYLRPEACIRAALEVATRQGAELRSNTAVHGIEEHEGGVDVVLTAGRIRARAVVLAAGAWTAGLAPLLERVLTVTRQVQGWVAPEDVAAAAALPCWLVDRGDRPPIYGVPVDPTGLPVAKIAVHGDGQVTTADALRREISQAERQDLREQAAAVIPGLQGPLVDARTCLYTSTPDGHFVLDRLPGHRHTWTAAGLSGHGFKLAPALGQALADLATEGATRLPVGFLELDRLR